ncbi:MAG: hypothetical protein EOO60_08630, partial [Hymenobacter sp.]
LIGFHTSKGITLLSAATGATISLNELRGNGTGDLQYPALDVQSSGATISNNLSINNVGAGLDGLSSTGSNVWTGNTVTNNGIGLAGNANVPGSTAGLRVYGAGNTVSQNLIYNNYGAGVLVNPSSTNTVITQNSIYGNGAAASANGTAASGQIGIDLENSGNNASVGNPAYVTINSTATSGANTLINYPIIQTAKINANTLTVTGLVTNNRTIELYIASPNSVTTSGATTGNSFGQGSSFLASQVVNPGGTTTNYSGTINGINQGSGSGVSFTMTITLSSLTPAQRTALGTAGTKLTATATGTGVGTSEFSGNAPITSVPTAYDVTNNKINSVSSNTVAPVTLYTGLTVPGAANDPVNDIVSFTVQPATNGTLYTDAAGTKAITAATTLTVTAAGQLYFRPTTNFTGNATFTFTATNNASPSQVSNLATYTIPVIQSNGFAANDDVLDAPANTASSGNVVLNDDNANNTSTFTATVITQPTKGTVTLKADGSYTYTPNNGYLGSDSFTYQICTGTSNCSNTATVNINVFEPSRVCSAATGP